VSAPAPVSSQRSFWPVGEAAQADYEALRTHVLTAGVLPDSMIAARFGRRGLAGLIAWPTSEPIFQAELIGATRPRWTPHADPRLEILAEGFMLLLEAGGPATGDALTGGDQRRWSR
jgi:hypothetical protein